MTTQPGSGVHAHDGGIRLCMRYASARLGIPGFAPGLALAALAILSLAAVPPGHAQEVNRPNIILIMADDLGYEGLSVNGSTSYRTPNLDRLAAEGMRFTRAYSTPLCTPTRVQLMTGKYNFRNYESFGSLNPREVTFADHLNDAGYATAIAGKWQLSEDHQAPFGFGFDEYLLWHFGRENKGPRYRDPVLVRNGVPVDSLQGRYGPDMFLEFITDFIDRHRDEPFLVYYPMVLTHSPFQPVPGQNEFERPDYHEVDDTTYFADMVGYMDDIVGRMVRHLESRGLAEETLILFTTDNGTHRSIHSRMGERIIQGDKGRPTDAGTHVPLIASWKGRIAPGQVNEDLIDFTDFLPTLTEAASVPLETWDTDGLSFYDRLMGEPRMRRSWIYTYYDPHWGGREKSVYAQDERYKLYEDGRFYDYVSDPLEKQPLPDAELSGEVAARKARLREVLGRFDAE